MKKESQKRYCAKILLFGEHIINMGGHALAMPLKKYSGVWQYTSEIGNIQKKQQDLPLFLHYLNEQKLDSHLNITQFTKDIAEGLYFESSIPSGYGVGSSGALCAAIFSRYKKKELKDFNELKNILAQMERFFHGKSSGIDPLVSYINQPIVFVDNKVTIDSIPPFVNTKLFLLDTKTPRSAGEYVKLFLSKKDTNLAFETLLKSEYIPLVTETLYSLLSGAEPILFQHWQTISAFQLEHLNYLIPSSFHKLFLEGLESKHFKLKICGAGGGGFLLGISNDFELTKAFLNDYDLIPIDF